MKISRTTEHSGSTLKHLKTFHSWGELEASHNSALVELLAQEDLISLTVVRQNPDDEDSEITQTFDKDEA